MTDRTATPVLSLQSVRHAYKTAAGSLEVLKGANLDLHPGEIVGLVGPSGSGKSTLLHAAGLLERPDGGAVIMEGVDCLSLSDRQRTLIRRTRLGFVYQFHHLLPEFNARDNVAAPLFLAGVNRTKARAEAERLLGIMGLSERMTHQPAQLSGGEQQRVAIARALANSPRVLIADEPTGNLDPGTTERVFKQLFEIARAEQVAVLTATHNLALMDYMDRVVTIQDGLVTAYLPGGVPPKEHV